MGNTLKKITDRAKKIYAKGGTWKGAIKQAGAEYREEKATSKKRRAPRPAHYKGRGKKSRRVRGISTKSRSHVDKNRMETNIQVGTIGGYIAKAKSMIADRIANKERQKFVTKAKRDKRKVAKEIADLKRQYKKL